MHLASRTPRTAGLIASEQKATCLSGVRALEDSYELVITICMCTLAARLKFTNLHINVSWFRGPCFGVRTRISQKALLSKVPAASSISAADDSRGPVLLAIPWPAVSFL